MQTDSFLNLFWLMPLIIPFLIVGSYLGMYLKDLFKHEKGKQ